MHNILEFNVLARTSTETTDTGAFEMSGVAENSKQLEDIGWDVRVIEAHCKEYHLDGLFPRLQSH
jgi:hypothetical protein